MSIDNDAGFGDDNSVKNKGVSLLAQWDVNQHVTLKSITAYREGDTETLIDFDTGPSHALDVPGVYDDNQTSEEVQFLWTSERVQAVAGLYYFDATASGAFDTILGIANLTIATSGRVDTKSKAAFADVSFDLTDQWALSLGGRYTEDKKTGTVYRQNFTGIRSPLFGNPSAIPGLVRTNYTNERTFSEFTPRASVTFKPTQDAMLYASYGRGFKSGGFDMRGDAFAYPQTVNGYDPELVDTYEIGGKFSLADNRVRLALAVYYSDYQDQQITSQFALPTVPPTIVSFVDNVASSEIRGAELEGNFVFTDSFSATLDVGYIDAKFNEFVTYDPATGTRHNLADQRDFQNTPEFSGSLSLTWRQQLGTHGGARDHSGRVLSGQLSAVRDSDPASRPGRVHAGRRQHRVDFAEHALDAGVARPESDRRRLPSGRLLLPGRYLRQRGEWLLWAAAHVHGERELPLRLKPGWRA